MSDDMEGGGDRVSIGVPIVVTPPPILHNGGSIPSHPPIHRPRRRFHPPPRVWTVFAVVGGSILGFGAVIGVATGLFIFHSMGAMTNPAAADDAVAIFERPGVILGMTMLAQMAMLAAALCGGITSPVPFRERLGVRRPSIPWWQLPILMLASIVPVALGAWITEHIHAILLPVFCAGDFGMEEQTQVMFTALQSGPAATALIFIALIALVPGIAEEFLFRGYMQRRFIERWGAWVGIAIASLCFGFLTGGATPGVFALPLGVWFGVIAWRTGSVWPAVCCHIAANAGWLIWRVGAGAWWSVEHLAAARLGILAAGGGALLISIPILIRATPSPRRWSPRIEPDPPLTPDGPAPQSPGDTPARSDPPHHPT